MMPKTSCGYVYENMKGHPLSDKRGRILKHRLVWFQNYGEIPAGYIIHHKNENKTDNRIENLEMTTRSLHMSVHHDQYKILSKNGPHNKGVNKEKTLLECGSCGDRFLKYNAHIRQSQKQGSTNFYCSQKCFGIALSKKRRALKK